jgi:flagellar hook-length control protein FliK
MQVLPSIVTPTPASSSSSSSSSSGADDGFLSILAEALTALTGENGDPTAESDADGAALAPAVEPVDVDGATGDPILVATLVLPGPELADVGTGTIDPIATGDAVGAIGAESAGDPTPPPTEAPVEVTVDVATPVEGEGGFQSVADGGSEALASPSARATDSSDWDAPAAAARATYSSDEDTAAAAPAASEQAGRSTDDALRVPGWVGVQGESATSSTTAVAEPAAATPSPALVTGLDVPTPTPTAATGSVAPTHPVSVAATMAAADLAAFEALEGDSPWQQLASVVRPLRQLPDGSHRLSLQLRPAELGAVHLEVALEDGRLSLRALAENVTTREVLTASLPELRAELARSGIDLGSLDVGDHTFGAGSDAEQGSGPASGEPVQPRGDAPPAEATTLAPTPGDAPDTDSSTRLDLTL